jgi:hypothetical protein
MSESLNAPTDCGQHGLRIAAHLFLGDFDLRGWRLIRLRMSPVRPPFGSARLSGGRCSQSAFYHEWFDNVWNEIPRWMHGFMNRLRCTGGLGPRWEWRRLLPLVCIAMSTTRRRSTSKRPMIS